MPIKRITDSKLLHSGIYSSKTLTKKRLKIELCAIRESLEKEEICSVTWANSRDQLADCLTKEEASREKLYDVLIGNSNSKLYFFKKKERKGERDKREE